VLVLSSSQFDPKLTWMSEKPLIYEHNLLARLTVANGFRRKGHTRWTEMECCDARPEQCLLCYRALRRHSDNLAVFFATSFLSKPTAPRTSQVRVVEPGIEIIRPQTQFLGTQTATISGPQQSQPSSRQEALARSQRVAIDTPRLRGSIALAGGRSTIFSGSISRNH